MNGQTVKSCRANSFFAQACIWKFAVKAACKPRGE